MKVNVHVHVIVVWQPIWILPQISDKTTDGFLIDGWLWEEFYIMIHWAHCLSAFPNNFHTEDKLKLFNW